MTNRISAGDTAANITIILMFTAILATKKKRRDVPSVTKNISPRAYAESVISRQKEQSVVPSRLAGKHAHKAVTLQSMARGYAASAGTG